MPTIDLNNRAEVAITFTNIETGALVDPAVVRVKTRNPDNEITTLTHPHASITKDGVGLYNTSILFDIPGKWLVRWEGTSSNETAEETVIHVNGSEFYDANGVELPDS